MHNGVVVIRQSQRVHIIITQLVEIVLLAIQNIRLLDDHMILAIWSRVLVPEADHMTQLVHHNSKLVAVLADGNRLSPITPLPHVRATATGALRKDNVVGVLVRIAFHKLDARKVLPMTHRLLEQCLVRPTKVRINLVGNHPVVPDSLLLSCRRPRHPPVCVSVLKVRLADPYQQFVVGNPFWGCVPAGYYFVAALLLLLATAPLSAAVVRWW